MILRFLHAQPPTVRRRVSIVAVRLQDVFGVLEYLRGDKQQVANRLSFEAYEFRLRREHLQAGTFARWIAEVEKLVKQQGDLQDSILVNDPRNSDDNPRC